VQAANIALQPHEKAPKGNVHSPKPAQGWV
jgi:hypothetical protein